jgi:hypothetical protein
MDLIKAKIKSRRGSYEQWYQANPVLEDGEIAAVSSGQNAGNIKVGDGITPWRDLPFSGGGGSSGGGSSNYNDLSNKPQIGGVTLSGNQTPAALGLATPALVTAEQTRASQAEADLNSAKLGKSFAQNVVTDIGVEHDATQPDRLYAKVTKRNPSTGADTAGQVDIPLADSANSGLMAHQDVITLAAHSQQIAALQGSIIPRGTVTQTTANVTPAILTSYIQTNYSRSPQAGDAVKDGSGVTWVYTSAGWVQWGGGSGDIGQFGQDTPGTITGSEQDGQVYAESDGTGSVVGWDSLKGRVSEIEENGAGMATREYESREAAEEDWDNIPLGARVIYPEEAEGAFAVITASDANISLSKGKYKITLVGGGSSGARGASNYGGPGGGGGGTVTAFLEILEGLTASCVIGSGGAAGSSATANNAGNASTLTIGSLVFTASGGGSVTANGTNYYLGAPGGEGGVTGTNAKAAVLASIILPGGAGESSAPAGSSAYGRGGRGGSSSLGQGGRGGHNGTTKTGNSGGNYGGGGGGGYGANNGGAGAPGALIIEAL